MKLENETPLSAHLFFGPDGETNLGCAVLMKATFDIVGDRLQLATKAPWPIHLAPLSTPYGTFQGEVAHRKPKTDVIVLGKAHAPGGAAVRSMTVSVSVGTFKHTLAIVGDRAWQRSGLGLAPSEPLLFREMPIVWANAYGGVLHTPVGDMPNTDNPEGKGFFVDEKEAPGVPLPNIEDPNALIRSPGDIPKPVGWGPYPLAGGVRMAKLFGPDGVPRPASEVEPFTMGWAHPDLIIETPAVGARIEVQGLTPDKPLVTAVPAFPARVVLLAGDERRTLTPRLDTLIVEAEERRLVVRWRASTTLEMRPREVRLVRIEKD